MFRFTIRELLLLTVIVALGIGWALRERQLTVELKSAEEWRGRAGALEDLLREEGWDVAWSFATGEVTTVWPSDHHKPKSPRLSSHQSRTTSFYRPSADPP
jgi:hypothetical protein